MGKYDLTKTVVILRKTGTNDYLQNTESLKVWSPILDTAKEFTATNVSTYMMLQADRSFSIDMVAFNVKQTNNGFELVTKIKTVPAGGI